MPSSRTLNVILNCLLVALLLTAATVIYFRFFRVSGESPELEVMGGLYVGSSVSAEIDWTKKKQTLIIALDPSCQYCVQSSAFYQRLSGEIPRDHTQVVALMSIPENQGRVFLDQLGLVADGIKQVSFKQVGVFVTPTIVAVDSIGMAKAIWIGKLDREAEDELLSVVHEPDGKEVLRAEDALIEVNELQHRLKANARLTIIDVDDREVFLTGHISGSVNIPFDELEARARHELDSSAQIIIYCRCVSDGTSRLAARVLYTLGFRDVSILKGGYKAWAESK